jgi:hypothetical protein
MSRLMNFVWLWCETRRDKKECVNKSSYYSGLVKIVPFFLPHTVDVSENCHKTIIIQALNSKTDKAYTIAHQRQLKWHNLYENWSGLLHCSYANWIKESLCKFIRLTLLIIKENWHDINFTPGGVLLEQEVLGMMFLTIITNLYDNMTIT